MTAVRGGRRYEASKWRVVSERPLPVFQTADGIKKIADLQSQSMCDLLHDQLHELPDGSVRGMIIDPIWKGWVTVRTTTGSNLESISPLPQLLTSEARILELQEEALADDIECDMAEMVCWNEEEVAEFFASGGATAPPRKSTRSTEVETSVPDLARVATKGSPAADTGTSSSSEQAAGEMNDVEARARDAGEWAKGTVVLLQGLKAARELNGRSGVLVTFDADHHRYEVRLAHRSVRVRPSQVSLHPLQRQREREGNSRGDEIVWVSEDAQLEHAGTYALKLDPQFWYDQALERVFNASNEFEVLELPVRLTEDASILRKAYRKVSLATHPDKNRHPQADAAFRKVYGAFETLSDLAQQRKLLYHLGRSVNCTDEERRTYAGAGAEDDDDVIFEWWWEASVPSIQKAAEEAEGFEMDTYAALYVSDGLGGDVNEVRWMGIQKAIALHKAKRVIFIDCRERADYERGAIPGAWHLPMSAVMEHGMVRVLGEERIHALLDTERHGLIVIYSNVATPFSRCRAFCRWLLRAGHHTLPVQRFRRLRGGLFGWEHRGGAVAKPIGLARGDLRQRLQLQGGAAARRDAPRELVEPEIAPRAIDVN